MLGISFVVAEGARMGGLVDDSGNGVLCRSPDVNRQGHLDLGASTPLSAVVAVREKVARATSNGLHPSSSDPDKRCGCSGDN